MTQPNTSLLEDYRAIATIRRFEERCAEFRHEGLIQGSLQLCNGQEAIPVGACRALAEQDVLTATYRGHGWTIARGVPLVHLFAEFIGRESPLSGGRGGTSFFCAPEHGVLGLNSIVGGGAGMAVGAALASRYDGSGAASLLSIGDGAMNQGQVHEALNFAAVYNLPLIIVLENNRYSELTPIASMVKIHQLSTRAAAYGFPGMTIDGNDIGAVTEAVAEARARALNGDGPTLIEAMTERIVGHYVGDIQHYRPKGEVEAAMTREPLTLLRKRGEQLGLAANLDAIEVEVQEAIAAAESEAKTFPMSSVERVHDHLYVD